MITSKFKTFKLLIDNILVSECGYNIEDADEFFNEKYIIFYNFKTIDQYRGKGYSKVLLNNIFDYVKYNLKLNIITLIVYKNNIKALNLYFSSGFEIFMEYDDSYSLIKKL
jgi:RimJ/RimL family protein N-acetyltransferase